MTVIYLHIFTYTSYTYVVCTTMIWTFSPYTMPGNDMGKTSSGFVMNPTSLEAPGHESVQLVNISPITMVYGTYSIL